MEIKNLYNLFVSNPLISTDTRKISQGSLFFALKGANFNGNKFAQLALESGASYAIIDEEEYAISDKTILVEDVLTTLQNLATFHRQQLNIPILGITGTNGKTTTKELVSTALSTKFKVTFTQGNLNNHIGVPLTLLSMTPETEFGVVEMGANHIGEIAELCEIAQPNFGIITNVGKAHLEGFGSFEGVKKTKSEMYRFLEKTNGQAFVHFENEHLREKLGSVNAKFYSTERNGQADFMSELIDASPFLTLKAKYPKGYLFIRTKLVGGYNHENVTAATAIANYFECDPIKVQKALETYTPENNRSQFKKTKKNQLILDAYNANPTSMKAAITNFAKMNAKEKVAILGDMLELGEDTQNEHQYIVDLLTEEKIDTVFLVGSCFQSVKLNNAFHSFPSAIEAETFIKENPIEGASILIKGSRGIKLETLINLL